jgi:hypothetical protein
MLTVFDLLTLNIRVHKGIKGFLLFLKANKYPEILQSVDTEVSQEV